jgi:tetratricopeptide (TPR) repeat protein
MKRFVIFFSIVGVFTVALFALVPGLRQRIFPEDKPQAIEYVDFTSNEESSAPNSLDNSNTGAEYNPIVEQPTENLTFDDYLREAERQYELGYFTLAANNYAAAIELNQNNKDIWLELIESYIALRDYNAAEQSLQAARKVFGNEPDLILLQGQIYLRQSQFDAAANEFALLENDRPEKFYYLGLLAAYKGEYESAQERLNIATNSTKVGNLAQVVLGSFTEFASYPEAQEPQLRLILASNFNKTRNHELAIQVAKEVRKNYPQYRDAWLILGHSYLYLERPGFAKEALSQAMEIDPTHPQVAYFLAIAESELGNIESAITIIEKALINGFTPKADAILKLGDFHLANKSYKKAAQKYEEALQLANNSAEDFIPPVMLYINYLKDYQKAITIAKWSVNSYPNSAISHNLVGWAEVYNGNLKQAKTALDRAKKIDPNYQPIYLNYGKMYQANQELEKAQAMYLEAHSLDPNSETGIEAAKLFNRLSAAS